MPDDVKLQGARALVARSGITVQRGVPAPAYYPGPDRVEMPNYSAFVCANLGYSYIDPVPGVPGWLAQDLKV